MTKLIWFRRSSQLFIILLFCVLPLLNLRGWHLASGTLTAFDFAGIPLADPATAAQSAVLGGAIGSWPIGSYMAGGLIAIAIAFLLGRIFAAGFVRMGFYQN